MPLPTDLALFHPGAQTPFPLRTWSLMPTSTCMHRHSPSTCFSPSKLFLNLEEAQVTNTLAPTDDSQGSPKNCQADSSSPRPWLGSSAPTIIMRLHFQQSRRPLSGAAPAKSSPEPGASRSFASTQDLCGGNKEEGGSGNFRCSEPKHSLFLGK